MIKKQSQAIKKHGATMVKIRDDVMKHIEDSDTRVRKDIYNGIQIQLKELFREVRDERVSQLQNFGSQVDEYINQQLQESEGNILQFFQQKVFAMIEGTLQSDEFAEMIQDRQMMSHCHQEQVLAIEPKKLPLARTCFACEHHGIRTEGFQSKEDFCKHVHEKHNYCSR